MEGQTAALSTCDTGKFQVSSQTKALELAVFG
jgi:hypothetical protein